MKQRFLLFFCVSCCFHSVAWSQNFDLKQLMELLSQNTDGRVEFVEKKRISQISRPIESSGEIIYTPPDKIERITLKPKLEKLVLEADQVTWQRGNAVRHLKLSDYPELGVMVVSIRSIIQGDRKVVQNNFLHLVLGSAQSWVLHLTPRDSKLGMRLKQMQISGENAWVQKIEITTNEGDVSEMLLTKPQPR